MTPTYAVRDWAEHFETSESRKRIGPLKWVAMKTKHDGKSFRRLTRLEDAAAILGAFLLLCEVAAKCPVRGVLADADGPLTADDLEEKTGLPAAAFSRAIEVLTNDRFRWLVTLESAGICRDVPEFQPTIHHTTPQDQTIQNPTVQAAANGVSKKRFKLDKKTTWEQIHTPAGASHIFQIALASRICTEAEQHHITRLILSLDGKAKNPVGLLVSILNGKGKDPWQARGGDFDKKASEWVREARARRPDQDDSPPAKSIQGAIEKLKDSWGLTT